MAKTRKGVYVLGRFWEIRPDEDLPKNEHGHADTDRRVIRISADSKEQPETLLHEILHAAFHESGWSESLSEQEEGLVRMLEHALGPIYARDISEVLEDE